MKKLNIVFGLVICTLLANAQKVWDGGGANNLFSNGLNWVGDVAPVSGEDVVFDGTNTKNCTFNVAFATGNFSINSGYTGVISIGSANRTIGGNFIINDGTFTSTSGQLNVGGNFTLGGTGTFNHNSGTVIFRVNSSFSRVITGSPVFNNLILLDFGSGGSYTFDFGSSTTANLTTDQSGGTGSADWNFQGNITITGNLFLESLNVVNPASNTGVFTFSGAGPITIDATNSATGANRLPNMVFNTTGTIDMIGDISVSGNWTHVDGQLTVGNGSTVHFYGSSTTIGDSSRFENLSVESGASVTFPAGGTFKIAGDFNNSGTFSPPPTSCMLLNGDGAAPQNINGTAFTIGKIEAADGTKTIEFNTAVTLLDVITIGDNVTLDANGGNLILNSANGGTKARIAPLGTSASIAGSITVQNFIPGGSPGWANLGTPGVSGKTVLDWDGQIPITCTGCTYDSTVITPPFTSVWKWDEIGETYQFGVGSDPLTPGKGYYVYVASDLLTASDYTLVYTGSAVTGNVNVTINVATFPGSAFTSNLISNPYPSPIEWDNVYASNGSSSELGSIYAWNAQANAYSVYTPGSGGSGAAGFGANGLMPAGQAFFLDADVTGFSFPMTMTFHESDKASSNSSEIFKPQNNNATKFKLFLHCPGEEIQNTLLHFNPQATENFDNYFDARQIFSTPGYMGYPGSYSKYNSVSTQWGGRDYAINTLPELTKTYTVPVLVKVASSGSYSISAGEFQNFYSCLVLHDILFDSYHNLMQSPYVFQINDTTSTPRFEVIICESGITNPNTIKELNASNSIFIVKDGNSALVNTRFETETKAEISAYNLLGQKLMSDIQVEGTETSTRLPLDVSDQVIFVRVSTNAEVVTKKLLLGR
ncbi:MAG: hypothetical protein JNK73_07000 [Bacteroidia bacterium]|nr:hypothetical protein [Bacteroidia bacterium]